MNSSAPELTHTLLWADGDHVHVEGKVDRFSCTRGNQLLMVSAVMTAQDAKAFRAALGQDPWASIVITCPSPALRGFHSGRYDRLDCGYAFASHKLGYGMAHAVAVCKRPGFLVDDSDEALWRELKSPRYTTPMLRSWSPYLRAQLAQADLLERHANHACHCCTLSASDEILDSIVESGLKRKVIRIER